MNKVQIWRKRRAYHYRDRLGTKQITLHDIKTIIKSGVEFDYADRSKNNPLSLEHVLLLIIKENEIKNNRGTIKLFTDCIKKRKSITNFTRSIERGKSTRRIRKSNR